MARPATPDTAEAQTELIDRHIAPHPHRPGVDNAWLPRYGYSVWIIVDALIAAEFDEARVARAYQIPKEAVQAVAAYYGRHRDAIDARINANAADFGAFA